MLSFTDEQSILLKNSQYKVIVPPTKEQELEESMMIDDSSVEEAAAKKALPYHERVASDLFTRKKTRSSGSVSSRSQSIAEKFRLR